MYKFKQDLAMAYFDGCSKKTASRLLAREINLTPGLLIQSFKHSSNQAIPSGAYLVKIGGRPARKVVVIK